MRTTPTLLDQIIADRYKTDPQVWIDDQREKKMSWDRTSRLLLTEQGVDITGQTLRNRYGSNERTAA